MPASPRHPPRLSPVEEIILLIYDIADPRRLRRVARACQAYGTRVQKSVFELRLRPGQLETLQAELRDIVHPHHDRVRYYRICGNDYPDIGYLGTAQPTHHPGYHIL